ncbi:helix-turn-helix transcriptional regulator [Chitinophaga agrisoli]|uniref:Helix-turn-helix transcriptional regulator n=1 Tax=Chitinophaga agrisoli TaxID=2607653 RepID=A0A5B2VZ61_9BACT|nr:AraC family transcriptional regulator [Chitinophaga agrisoli]KAA2243622.1 helix-turn-helix transcriptional regulator [Chitinophaga agrisoli]
MSTDPTGDIILNNLLYSCLSEKKRGNEQFVPEHTLGIMLSGESQLLTPRGNRIAREGMIGLIRRNQLVKALKVPGEDGQFRSISIFLTQDALRRYSAAANITASGPYTGDPLLELPPDPFLEGFFHSLMPYFDQPGRLTSQIADLKTNEAIELLLQHNPRLSYFLFDFSEPHKINLEAFMNQNYMYNVPVSKFAQLTGRSLAGFKRDFEKIFRTSPRQWLMQKRLSEAYYMIKEKGRKPSDVYLDVGFENLSHFSFAFKKTYGVAPSMV